jgi:hypothetical protein
MEDGRRKMEDAIKSRVSAIKNVLTSASNYNREMNIAIIILVRYRVFSFFLTLNS